MRKTIAVVMAVALVGGAFALPADAGKRKKKKPVVRVMEARYENPAFGTPISGGTCVGCPSFPVAATENFVMIEVTDDVNPGGGSRVSWDTDGDGTNDTGFYVCGSTPEPMPIPAGTTIVAFPYPVGHPTECPGGGATTGTIKMTFSALP